MLSAKSDGTIYISGGIPDPKSREYECVQCEDKVFHVAGHRRSAEEWVTEHFRHRKNATHPIRGMSKMQGDALEFILDKLSKEYEIEVLTDQIYTTNRGDIPTDILAREHFPDGPHVDTVIQVEANPFVYKDFQALHNTLSEVGVYFMPVLCAQGMRNHRGKFFRSEVRDATGLTVKSLGKNEKALYRRMGNGIYFDHDERCLLTARFRDYEEQLEEDIISGGYVVREAGQVQTFSLKKEFTIVDKFTDRFKFQRRRHHYGLNAYPREMNIEDYIQKEQLAEERDAGEEVIYDFSERVGIMLENCSEDELRRLTKKYGPEYMGMMAVE